MWKCKKCGTNIAGVDINKQSLEVDKEGIIRMIFNEDIIHSYYECEDEKCGTKTNTFQGEDIGKLKEIAYWTEEE